MAGFGFLSIVLIARFLGPSGRGQTAAAVGVFYLAPMVLSLGVPLYIRRLAASGSRNLRKPVVRLAVTEVPVCLLLSVLLYCTLFASFDAHARLACLIAGCFMWTPVMWSILGSVLIGREHFAQFMVVQVAQPLSFVVCLTVLAALDCFSVGAVVYAHGISNLATAAVAFIVTADGTVDEDGIGCWELVRGGGRFLLAVVTESALNRLDQVVALPLLGAVEAGYYSAAASIPSLLLAVGHAVAASKFVAITRAARSDAIGESRRLHSELIQQSISVGLTASLIAALLVPVFVPIAFGPSFQPALIVFFACTLSAVPMIAAYAAGQALVANGLGAALGLIQGIGLIAALMLLLVLGPAVGALGAALASGGGFLIVLLLSLPLLRCNVSALLPRPGAVASAIQALVHKA